MFQISRSQVLEVAENVLNEVWDEVNEMFGGSLRKPTLQHSGRQVSYYASLDHSLNISTKNINNAATVKAFVEYKRFELDREIGSIKTDDWKMLVRAVTIHELAHAVQRDLLKNVTTNYIKTGVLSGYGSYPVRWLSKPHGKGFQDIYRLMRRRFVNHLVSDPIGFGWDAIDPEDRAAVQRKKSPVYTDNNFVGKTVILSRIEMEITGYKPRNYKYPYLAKTKSGKMYKLSKDHVMKGLANVTLRDMGKVA